MRLAYYPGCSAKGSSADYEMSTQAVCGALGMRLEELPDWNCCGSTPAHAVDTELSAALCVRNLDIAARTQADMVVTPCPSCLSNLRHAAKRMEKPEFRARVNELLDNPAAESFPPVTSVMQGIAQMYDAKAIASRVKRSLRGLKLVAYYGSVMQGIAQMYDAKAIASRVKRSLRGLKLVAYYGCLMSRPAELMQFGDPENPTLMEELLGACGAEMLDFPLKTECCGASFGIPERPMTAQLSGRILEVATNMGADAIVVACPLCQMNLDLRQKQAMKGVDRYFNMPVLYYTQMMGLAFGMLPSELGLDKLVVSANALVERILDTQREDAQKAQAPEGDKA